MVAVAGNRTRDALHLRLVATLGAIVLVDLAVLVLIAWTVFAVLGSATDLDPAAPSVSVAAGALAVAALVLVSLQARLGYRRILPADGREAPESIADRVRRLAMVADVAEPDVRIAPTDEPNSFTVGNGSEATVVVTRGLVERLDPAELEAVLAHEVAHVANRDVTVATVAATISGISATLFARERRLREWVRLLLTVGLAGGIAMLVVAVPLLLVVVAYAAVSLLARVLLAANAVLVGLHARQREYAADRTAAALTGEPSALASALDHLDGGPVERDAREAGLHASATLGIVPRSLGATESEPRDSSLSEWLPDDGHVTGWASPDFVVYRLFGRIGRAVEWRPKSHPPVEKRIARLRAVSEPNRTN